MAVEQGERKAGTWRSREEKQAAHEVALSKRDFASTRALLLEPLTRLSPTHRKSKLRMEFSLQEELSALSDGDYDFPNQLEVDTMDPAEVNATLNGTPPLSCQSSRY